MNKACRVIWSHVHRQMVVVSEIVSSRGKTQTTLTANGDVGVAAALVPQPQPLSWALAMAFATTLAALGLSVTPARAQTAASVANTALPTGGSVAAGSATINQSGANMVIDQASQRAVINWQSFNVGKDAHVHFNNAGGSTLNRVTGPEASTILGRITAPGQVIISNGNGVFFGRGSMVDVGSLIATTHGISNERFMAGDLTFERNGSTASVINEGELRAKLEGYIALIAPEVRNQGLIVATKGTVALAAGEVVELQLDPNNKLTNIRVSAGQWQALVDNKQAIEAEGGLVILSAMAARELQGSVVNNSGSINASSLTSQGGRIILTADHISLGSESNIAATGATGGGQVLVGGDWQGGANAERRVFEDPNALHQATTVTMEAGATIDASATDNGKGGTVVLWSDIHNPESVTTASGTIYAKGGANGGDGGQIETSGGLLITEGASGSAAAPKGKAGEWLFDPTNVTIGTSGMASAQNNGTSISASSIASLLNGGTSVTVTTSSGGGDLGDLTVNSAISKSSGNSDVTLTLRAANSIVINQAIQHTGGSGKLHLVIDADNNTAASTSGSSPVRDGGGITILEANLSTGGGNVTFGGTATGTGGIFTGGDLFVGGSNAVTITTSGGAVDVKGNLIIANSSTEGFSIVTSGGAIHLRKAVDSGNQYTRVAVQLTWEQAKADAIARGGWLATIGSSLENALAIRAANYQGAWLGGERIIGTNEWRWTADPNYNATTNPMVFFYQGTTTQTSLGGSSSGSGGTTATGYYSNFGGGEPNNWNGSGAGVFSQDNESVLQFIGAQANWNDLPRNVLNSSVHQYVLETNLAPSRLQLNAGSGAVNIGGGVGFSKALSQLNVTSSNTSVTGSGIITTGAQTYSSGVNVSNVGRIEVSGTNVTFNGNFNVTATGASGSTHDVFLNAVFTNNASSATSFNVQTPRHIQLGSNFSLTSSNAALNTTLWADSDKSSDGIIFFEGSGITTRGGTLTFGKAGETATVAGSTVLVGGDVFFQRGSAQSLNTSLSDGNGGAINIYGETIVANTAGLTINSGNGNVTLHGLLNSGNSYSFVSTADNLNWNTARTEARAGTGGGSAVGDSYLVTITSRLENSIAGLTARYQSAWIGAYRDRNNTLSGGDARWYWADGPEANVNFYNQSDRTTVSGYFTQFANNEPNGTGTSGEAFGQFFGADGLWNDLGENGGNGIYMVKGYVRETNLAASPVTINAGTGAVAITGGVGTAKALSTFDVTGSSVTVNGNGLVTTGAQTYSNALSVTSSSDIRLKATALSITGADQNLLLKAANDIRVDTSITTQKGDVVLWANTAGASTGGGIFFELGAGIATNGGHLWMGGSASANGSTTWNGLTVGNGYAVSGTTVVSPVTGDTNWLAGVSFKRNIFNTAGGDISIYGKSNETLGIGVSTHREVTFNAGEGQVVIEGINDRADARNGFLWGMHSGNIGAESSSVNITSSYSGAGNAVTLVASHGNSGRPAAGLSELRLNATGSGGVYINSVNTAGGVGLQLGGAEILTASGDIVIETGASGLDGPSNGSPVATIGFKAVTAVTASSSNITFISNNPTNLQNIAFNTTGALTIRPVTNSSFGASLNTNLITYSAGITGLTVGGQGNTANITVGSAINIAGPISVYGGDIAINANVTTTAGGANILFKATGNILQTTASTTVSTNSGSVIYWADSDGNSSGRIDLDGATVSTSGGGIWMGGGAGTTTWVPYANATALTVGNAAAFSGTATYGVNLNLSTLNAGSGNIWLSGRATGTSNQYGIGTRIYANNTGTAGLTGHNITITGIGSPATGTLSDHWGVAVIAQNTATTSITASGTLSITGTGGGGNTTGGDGRNHGIWLERSNLTSTGDMTLTGQGGGSASGGTDNDGVLLLNGTTLHSGAGTLTIIGTRGFRTGSEGLSLIAENGVTNTLGHATTQTGNMVLRVDSLGTWTGSSGTGVNQLLGAGSLSIEPLVNATSFVSNVSTSGLTLGSNFTGLTIGKEGNTANITLSSATTVNGPINLYGGAIAINAALTASNGAATPVLSNINIYASGAVTQTAAIVGGGLGLHGAGSFTLNNAGNNITTLAGGTSTARLGSLSFTNANALTIGTVNPTGIWATGDVRAETLSGNLTLSESINTLSTSATAIVLNAGKNAAAGAAAGGDIIVTGAPTLTMDTGGRATLFTGSVAGSTGLSALVGFGSERFRYNRDEVSTNYTGAAALSSGVYGIYRESPSLTLTASAQTITYGESPTLTGSVTGAVNGDSVSTLAVFNTAGTALVSLNGSGFYDATASASEQSPTNSYTINVDAKATELGYTVAGTGATLRVNRRELTIRANDAAKFYTQAEPTTYRGVTFSGFAAGESSATLSGTVTYTRSTTGVNNDVSPATVATGEMVGTYALSATFTPTGGHTATANYEFVQPTQLGSFTINPVNRLVVDVGNVTPIYGDARTYSAPAKAQYVAAPNSVTVVDVTTITVGSTFTQGSASGTVLEINGNTLTLGNVTGDFVVAGTVTAVHQLVVSELNRQGTSGFVYLDGAGKTVSFNVVEATASNAATSGMFNVGSYSLAATNLVTTDGFAISNGVKVLGTLTVTPKVVSLSATKVYDGSTTLTGSQLTITTGVGTEQLSFSNAQLNSKDVATASFVSSVNLLNGTGTGAALGLASNYTLPSLAAAAVGVNSATITRKDLGFANTTKVYDGNDSVAGALGFTGLVGGEVLFVSAATSSGTDVGTGFDVSSVTIGSSSAQVAGNYTILGQAITAGTALSFTANAGTTDKVSITPRPIGLVATKVYDGNTTLSASQIQFVGINGVQQSGLVAGEAVGFTSAVLAGKDVLTADNHIDAITLADNGSFKAANYILGVSGPSLGTALTGLSHSAAHNTAQVTKRQATISSSSVVSKVYDGTASLANVSITFDGVVSGETISINTSGATGGFSDASAGTGKSYTLTSFSLTGTNLNNYEIVGLSGSSLSGNNGVITQKTLTVTGITAVSRDYNGGVGATVSTASVNFAGLVCISDVCDDLTVTSTGVFDNKNAGTNKTVTLTNTYGGAALNNYAIVDQTSTTATISQLDSVTWVGGDKGNWFDPNNWAGGAVPDLSNVKNVVIPDNKDVVFDTAGAVAPAETGPVEILSIQQANGSTTGGGSLTLTNGELNIGTGGAQLDTLTVNGGELNIGTGGAQLNTLTVNGGELSNTGDTTVKNFAQTNGEVDLAGSFTVTESFSQANTGTLEINGTTSITDTSGGIVLGNITTNGTTSITSLGGDITQHNGSVLNLGGETTLVASNGAHPAVFYDILLGGENNFGGTVNVVGAEDVTLNDVNGLTLGNITTTGKLDATAATDIAINGAVNVKTLDLEATAGDISQGTNGTLTVTQGPTDLKAGDDITLDKANDFNGTVNVIGANDVVLNATDSLTLGNVTTTGKLDAAAANDIAIDGIVSVQSLDLEATAGDISQGTNGTLKVTQGPTDLKAGDDITLDKANDFNGTVNVIGANDVVLNATDSLTLGNVTTTGKLEAIAVNDVVLNGTVSVQTLDLEATSGDIVQNSGTLTVTNGPTNLKAADDITLDGANDFNGTVNADGGSISLNDVNGITLGNITTQKDVNGNGGGLTINAGGNIAQDTSGSPAKKIVVDGQANMQASPGNIALNGDDNDFKGTVNAKGQNIELKDANGITLGDIAATGGLQVDVVSGSINQDTTGNKKITVNGKTDLAATGPIALNGDFKGGVAAQGATVSIQGDRVVEQKAAEQKAAAAAASTAAASAAASNSGTFIDRLPTVTTSQPTAALAGPDAISPASGLAGAGGGQGVPGASAGAQGSAGAAGGNSSAAGSAGGGTPGIQVELVDQPRPNQLGVVSATLPPGTSTAGTGFTFSLPAETVRAIVAAPDVIATLADGSALPSWLTFDPTTGEFKASAVPDQAFPIQISLTWGGQQLLVVISERQD